jgi:hypothetical protein
MRENWWHAVHEIVHGTAVRQPHAERPLSARFDVAASMTAGDAYDLAPLIVDSPRGPGPKLVTTGLIDPGVCLWGETTCRYLKRDYRHPRIRARKTTSGSLARRLAKARRPKLLVAGLSSVVECFVDRRGEVVGAVSTYSIFDPDDDLRALDALCAYLCSPEITRRFRAELGGNAMGGGNTTMTKAFLRNLPLPPALA